MDALTADSTPLRIGVLGASRIATAAVAKASAETGDVLASVAARSPERARQYADEHGYEDFAESYRELIADESLDLVYVGLPNGLHAEWAVHSLHAGRNVLVEKPFAANLAEFEAVADVLKVSRGWAWEAFHYSDHPATRHFINAVISGEIGELREIRVCLKTPMPSPSDPRWSYNLAGGAMMDLGCYALHVLLLLGDNIGSPIDLISAEAEPYSFDERVDAAVRTRLSIGNVPAVVSASMVSSGREFSLKAIGSRGSVTLPNFVKPHEDNRLIVSKQGKVEIGMREERIGSASSYAYQLRRVHESLRKGERSAALLERSRRTIALIDAVYASCGMPARGI